MRYARQSKIIEIIKQDEICTQEELSDRLNAAGFKATQATVSRDIKELGLIKVTGRSGKSCYAETPKISNNVLDRYGKILKETVVNIKAAENLLVVKTLPGCAGAAAEVIDKVPNETIVGTIAGDNTILIILDKKENAEIIINQLKSIIG